MKHLHCCYLSLSNRVLWVIEDLNNSFCGSGVWVMVVPGPKSLMRSHMQFGKKITSRLILLSGNLSPSSCGSLHRTTLQKHTWLSSLQTVQENIPLVTIWEKERRELKGSWVFELPEVIYFPQDSLKSIWYGGSKFMLCIIYNII